MLDGKIEIKAGPPKKREPFPKVCKNSEKLLSDVINEHESDIHDQLVLTAQ